MTDEGREIASDRFRLGPYRRNKRDYSEHQRCTGLDAGDRMKIRFWDEYAKKMLFLYVYDRDQQIKRVKREQGVSSLEALTVLRTDARFQSSQTILQLITIIVTYLHAVREPHLIVPRRIDKVDYTFDCVPNVISEERIGFTRNDIISLYQHLHIPDRFVIDNGGDSHRFHVSGSHAFLYFLSRYHCPSPSVFHDIDLWHYDSTTLRKIFNSMVDYIDDHYSYLLDSINKIVSKLPSFNQKILTKITELNAGIIPPEAVNCSLFVDGIRFEVSRPEGDFYRQKLVFSGDKWYHNHGCQGTIGPDGMFYHWWDRPLGRFSDRHFMTDSKLNNLLRSSQHGKENQYWAYGDKGYDYDTHIRCAYHGPGYVSEEEKHFNYIMSRERIGVEWGNAKIYQRCPLLKRVELLKLQLVDVRSLVRVGVLLTNFHTSLHQSSVGFYFNCFAPSLPEYLS